MMTTAQPTAAPETIAEQIDHEALAFREQKTHAAEIIADALDKLSQMVRWTGARTAEEHDWAMERWEDEIRERWEARGFTAGRQSCPCGQNDD